KMSITESASPNMQTDTGHNEGEFWSRTATPFCNTSVDTAQIKYQQARVRHWNEVADKLQTLTGLGGYYHRRLTEVYQSLVSPGQLVLELGCGRGDLLAALKPASGVGVDFSAEMIHAGRERHPNLRF